MALQERTLVDDLRTTVETFKRELDMERDVRQVETTLLQVEKEKTTNLQSVLQDFQAGMLRLLPPTSTLSVLWLATS